MPRTSIGRLIDRETHGDRIALAALRFATGVLAAVAFREPITFCVVSARDTAWEPCDTLFVRFLVQGLRSTAHRFVLASLPATSPRLPADWKVTWSDPPDPPATAAAPSYALARPAPASAPEEDPVMLCEQARREIEAGGWGIGLHLLDRAMASARTSQQRVMLQLLAQGARIASGRFEEAAREPDPDERLSPFVRGLLWHTKGWALTMRNRAEEAEACLRRARDLLESSADRESYLYVLNISALNLLKLGDWQAALALEERIRSELSQLTVGGWQLRYINSLNLARLHRRRHRFDDAARHYREAFATTAGARSESDLVYMNVCSARLDGPRGRHSAAFHAWVRAALHWAASEAPEAIGPRVTSAITAGATDRSRDNVCDDVSNALVTQLAATAEAAGLHGEVAAMRAADHGHAPVIVRSLRIESGQLPVDRWRALRGPGGWVLGSDAGIAPHVASPANRSLRAALGALLSPARGASGDRPDRTVVVDDQLGHDLPLQEAQLVASCLRLGVRDVALTDSVVELDVGLRSRLEDHLRVRVGDAVDQLDLTAARAVVTFKRYREPQRIAESATIVLRRIADSAVAGGAGGVEIAELRRGAPDSKSLIPLLRSLERERVIELSFPDGSDLLPPLSMEKP